MADQKISELTNITGANLADADEFVVVDTSADQTKAITFGELKTAFDTGTGFVRVTGDTMTGDLSFGDSDRAIFGASNDLQIYHDGNNSIIDELGTGNLYLRGSNVIIQNRDSDPDEMMITAIANGAVTLSHNGAAKIATTATGVDVTGTVTADGLTVDGNVSVTTAIGYGTSADIDFVLGASNVGTGVNDSKALAWRWEVAGNQYGQLLNLYEIYDNGAANAERKTLTFNSGGDISFYEDTGTTPKFYWDSSAEALGINVTDPIYPLEVQGEAGIELYNGTGGGNVLNFRPSLGDANKYNLSISSYDHSGNGVGPADGLSLNGFDGVSISTGSNTTRQERMRITEDGSVGIGTSSPSYTAAGRGNLNIAGSSGAMLGFQIGGVAKGYVFHDSTNLQLWNEVAGPILFGTSGATRMTIDSSGNVGVTEGAKVYFGGVTDPSSHYIKYNSGNNGLELNSYGSTIFTNTLSATERMRIDASGNVGIGTSSPNDGLHINLPDPTITLQDSNNPNTPSGKLRGYDGILSLEADTGNVQANSYVGFSVDGSERMRIDASGNVLVGKTAANNTVVGVEAKANGNFSAVADNITPVLIRRKTSDGDLIEFAQNSTTVGSIGSKGGVDMYIGKGTTGLRFYDGSNSDAGTGILVPWNTSTNLKRDAQMNLGSGSERFNSLYLSGGVYLGGTGAANKLDDYEEGTWTPTLFGQTTAGTPTYTFREGWYVKVGSMVTVSAAFNLSALSGVAGDLRISGLPFTSTATFTADSNVGPLRLNGVNSEPDGFCVIVIGGEAAVAMRSINANSDTNLLGSNLTNTTGLGFQVSYRT
tara:strand:+ start:3177 stop:5639 length:2463 start_codon:yes stop_codon:yes gene_type:complete